MMTGDDVRAARRTLGEMWGIGRPLHMSELARALRYGGRDPGDAVRKAEMEGPTGPASVAIEMMLAGAPPPDGLDKIIERVGPKRSAHRQAMAKQGEP